MINSLLIMSKIAKIPVEIKEGVQLSIENGQVKVTGAKGNLSFSVPSGVLVEQKEGKVFVKQDGEGIRNRALSGLVRASIANMVKGVSEGFSKKLELTGVGYRAQATGNSISLSVGYSHQVKITADPTIVFNVEENIITVTGPDKTLVGDMAAKIRAVRPPEPYKGKGIKYQGEYIRRKVGKAAKAVGAVGAK